MQRIWGWSHLEKFFFLTKWAHQQRTCMYERIVRDISLIFYEFRVALCDFCAFFTWIFENRVSKNINSFCNLRSGSIFVSLWKLHSGGQGETKREPDTKRLRNVFHPLFYWLTFAESDNQITSVTCFFSMQIFHTREKCRLTALKNRFYLLIFSRKNKTVSTITFNFLRD